MFATKRPYIVIPKLIEQQTWGSDYILRSKNWGDLTFFKNKKIGQSYELFSQSKLLLNIKNTKDEKFIPELGFAEADQTVNNNFDYTEGLDYINLSSLIKFAPNRILGKKVVEVFEKMPLLIKFTQAMGNSFQIHIKPGVAHPRWRAKTESWLYLEDGLLTYGIKAGININDYKQVCREINTKMQQLSNEVLDNKKDLNTAKQEAPLFIKQLNPWQFVNFHQVKKNSVIDLSLGGVHHSWEEDMEKHPLGNVLYEIQQDVMDPTSTIRCFDKGKFKNDRKIREIHIDDYFQFLDKDGKNNEIGNVTKKRLGRRLLNTKIYCLDILEIRGKLQEETKDSFDHLFVLDGDVNIFADGGEIHLGSGHSCFLPQDVDIYEIKSNSKKSIILKTFIDF